MIVNVGLIDRTVRLLLSLALLIGMADGFFTETAGMGGGVAWWIGLALGFTAVFRVCPVYLVLGFDTTARDANARDETRVTKALPG